MDTPNLEEQSPALSPLDLSSEQRQILDHLCLCRELGPGPHPGRSVRALRIILFFAFCVAVCAGLIVFANHIPPLIGLLMHGFFVGVLVMVVRQQIAFERQWPLLELIIDWKFVDQLRKTPKPPTGSVTIFNADDVKPPVEEKPSA